MAFAKPRFSFLARHNYSRTPELESHEFQRNLGHDTNRTFAVPNRRRLESDNVDAATRQNQYKAESWLWDELNSRSQINLTANDVDQAHYRRYLFRSILNVVGPLSLVGIYVFIVIAYLLRPVVNDISPGRPIDGRGLFFAWTVISVFIIDWAKSGFAGLEAALLTRSKWWTPSDATQLLWHADRTWGTLNGWARSIRALFGRGDQRTSKRPSYLWWYLCLNSMLLYAAIPLAGLSLDRAIVYQLGDRYLLASGTNQSSFNSNRMCDGVGSRADSSWRTGEPVTGAQADILYAPEGTLNVSAAYYEDAIQAVYQQDLQNVTVPVLNRTITFFTGPSVSERAHSSAWGLKTTISCFSVNPRTGLRNMKVQSFEDWSGTPIYGTNGNLSEAAITAYNGSQYMMFIDQDTDIMAIYFMATERAYVSPDIETSYSNISAFPLKGSIELVMWHADPEYGLTNVTWPAELKKSQYVISTVAHGWDDMEFIGYGVRCEAESATGFAKLDASKRTFSDFQVAAANPNTATALLQGIMAIQDVVFATFTGIRINQYPAGKVFPPACAISGRDECGAWFGANKATNGGFTTFGTKARPFLIRDPIFPPRMVLAMYKLFGETAIAMLVTGPRNWQSNLQGLDVTNDVIPGIVPWPVPFAFLVAWALGVVIPSILTFGERRFASTVGAFEMFRMGTEVSVRQANEAAAQMNENLRKGKSMLSEDEVYPRKSVKPTENTIEMMKYPQDKPTSSSPERYQGEPQGQAHYQSFI